MTTLAASDFLESSSIEHFFRGNVAPSSSAYLSLYWDSPGEDDSGTEITGSSYQRMLLAFETPTVGTASLLTKVGLTASGETLGIITHFGIHDNATKGTGNLLAYGALTTGFTGSDGTIITFDSGSLTLTWGSDITQKFGNMLIDHFFNITESPASTAYLGLSTADPGVNGIANECSNVGYSRQALTWDVTGDGIATSSLEVNFTAGEDWSGITHGVVFLDSSALTASFAKALSTTRTLGNGDTLRFQVAALTLKID